MRRLRSTQPPSRLRSKPTASIRIYRSHLRSANEELVCVARHWQVRSAAAGHRLFRPPVKRQCDPSRPWDRTGALAAIAPSREMPREVYRDLIQPIFAGNRPVGFFGPGASCNRFAVDQPSTSINSVAAASTRPDSVERADRIDAAWSFWAISLLGSWITPTTCKGTDHAGGPSLGRLFGNGRSLTSGPKVVENASTLSASHACCFGQSASSAGSVSGLRIRM